MEELIKKISCWQNEHIASFHIKDEGVANAFRMKREHIAFVRKHSKDLAENLRLSPHQASLAELIGLTHDLGRFAQYDKYETFNDSVSVDHASLALQIFKQCPYREELSARDLFLLEFAIFNHNKKAIEETDDDDAILLAKIIRDADKLDIYRVLRPYLVGDAMEGAPNFVKATDVQDISPEFMEIFVEGKQADYRKITTHGDRKLVRLLWVYDVYFPWTMQKITEAGYIEEIAAGLQPKNERFEIGWQRLREYINNKLAEAT
ncbi:MAG: HD domain-containing protein [Selenomonadaceae bacterium]|nr:HD domain-containing protein [Selenomonadaceae bacterium]